MFFITGPSYDSLFQNTRRRCRGIPKNHGHLGNKTLDDALQTFLPNELQRAQVGINDRDTAKKLIAKRLMQKCRCAFECPIQTHLIKDRAQDSVVLVGLTLPVFDTVRKFKLNVNEWFVDRNGCRYICKARILAR
ncbi:hypothetical protein MspRI1_16850 [Marinobacter sp. RI1]